MQNMESVKTDIVDFLKHGRLRSLVMKGLRGGRKIPPFLMLRLLALAGLKNGYFSPKEARLLIMPGRFRPKGLTDKYWKFLDDEAQKELRPFLTGENSVTLYGRPFHFPTAWEGDNGYHYLAALLLQITVFDQYHFAENHRPGGVIIDAGANIGAFSVFAAHVDPSAKIYAFEPQPEMFAFLKENVKELPNVACYNLGLGETEARRTMYGHTFEDSGFGVYDKVNGKEAAITTVDDFVKKNGLPKIDFIKMDTEGYEGQILSGAKDTVRRFGPVITMSAYHHKGDEKRLKDILLAANPDYVCELKTECEPDLLCVPKPALRNK